MGDDAPRLVAAALPAMLSQHPLQVATRAIQEDLGVVPTRDPGMRRVWVTQRFGGVQLTQKRHQSTSQVQTP